MSNTGINFTLERYKAPAADDPNTLLQNIRYQSKNIELESDEYRASIGFLGQTTWSEFTDDQTDVFYKTMYNFMTTRDPFERIAMPVRNGSQTQSDAESVGGQEVFEIE